MHEDDIRNGLRVINAIAFVSAMQWQAFLPTLPLLVTRTLGLPVDMVAWPYAVFTASGLMSIPLLLPLTRRFSTLTITIAAFAARIIAGLVHSIGIYAPPRVAFSLIVLSRAIHGITVLLFTLGLSWIGARVPTDQKPAAIAHRMSGHAFDWVAD